jgi:DNA-binding LacI/PurR family transcriptional regulator
VARYLDILTSLRGDTLAGIHQQRLPPEVDLARHYGVSRMTLRRAISALIDEGILESRQGSGTYVRTEAQQARIVEVVIAESLNDHPEGPFQQQLMLYLLNAAAQRGWTLRVAPHLADLQARLSTGRASPFSACIAVAYATHHREALAQLPVPVVSVDGEPTTSGPTILPDNQRGIATAVTRLRDLGHRRIAHLAGPQSQSAGRERLEGFCAAMTELGLAVDGSSVKPGDFTIEAGQQAMESWWRMPTPPTAVVCANDMMAIGAAHWLLARGLRVGRDVSLVGFDGLPLTKVCWPPLATLEIDFSVHATAVMDAVQHPEAATIRRTPLTLVERPSLGPCL